MKTPRIITMTALTALLTLAALMALACGDDDKDSDNSAAATVGDIQLHNPFGRSPGDPPRGAVYVHIQNTGDDADALVKAESDVAGTVELHTVVMEDGQATMKPVAKIDVAANGTTELKPGGFHVMLIDLKRPLKVGEEISVKLTFEKAGSVELKVPIEEYVDMMGTATPMGSATPMSTP